MTLCRSMMMRCALKSVQSSGVQRMLAGGPTQHGLHLLTKHRSNAVASNAGLCHTHRSAPPQASLLSSRATHQGKLYTPAANTCGDPILSLHLHTTLKSCGSSPAGGVSEYQCPTRLSDHLSRLVILDGPASPTLAYECPVSQPVTDTRAPDQVKEAISEPAAGPPISKEAKMIMRIRHKKMKKHKLRKLRKRMYFLWRKQKLSRKAKRMTIYNRELDEIKAKGENFDAEEFVRSQLAKARRGGYYINVFESKM